MPDPLNLIRVMPAQGSGATDIHPIRNAACPHAGGVLLFRGDDSPQRHKDTKGKEARFEYAASVERQAGIRSDFADDSDGHLSFFVFLVPS